MNTRPNWHVAGTALGLLLALVARTSAQSGTWTATTDGTWTDAVKWQGGIVATGATHIAAFAASLAADRVVTIGSTTRTIGHLAFTNTGATARQWTLSSSGGTQYLTYDADGAGGGTSSVDVAAATTFKTGYFAGSSALRKSGPGTFTLANANSLYAGTITAAEGTLHLEHVDGAKTVTVRLDPGDRNCTLSVGAPSDGATFSIGNLQVPATGTGTVTIAKPSGGTRSVLSAPTVINRTVHVSNTSPGPLSLDRGVSGAGGLLKTGTGGLYFTTSMSYTGGTTIRHGHLWLINNGNVSLIPSGQPVTLGDTNTDASAVGMAFAGSGVRPNMQLHVTTNGTSATIQAGMNGQNAGSHIVYGTIQIDRPFLTIQCNSTYANDVLISAAVSGAGGVQTSGSDTKMVRFNTANTYAGGTKVTAGRLRVLGSGTLGSGAVTVSASATLDLDVATAIADDAAVVLAKGDSTYGRVDLASGVNETVGSLTLDGKLQFAGSYGATGSGAANIDDSYFVGTGKLTVLAGPARGTVVLFR